MVDATFLSTAALAFGAGVTTFFSPCAFPLLPGYVGYYANRTDGEGATLGGSLARGLVAGAGVLVTLTALVGASFVVGSTAFENVALFEPVVGVLLVVFGLLVVVERAPSLSVALPKRRASVFGFGIFGAGYALASVGCIAPFFVGVVSSALSLPPAQSALVVGIYVGTVVVLMISLTVVTGTGLLASAGRLAAYTGRIERAAGVLMILAGLGQLYLSIFVLDVL